LAFASTANAFEKVEGSCFHQRSHFWRKKSWSLPQIVLKGLTYQVTQHWRPCFPFFFPSFSPPVFPSFSLLERTASESVGPFVGGVLVHVLDSLIFKEFRQGVNLGDLVKEIRESKCL
jgi:hypothetical protein